MKQLVLGLLVLSGAVACADTTVTPTNISLQRGILLSGSVDLLREDDGQSMVFRPGIVMSSSEAPVSFTLGGTSPISPTRIRIRINSLANNPNISQRLEAVDFSSGTFVMVDQGVLETQDQGIEISLDPAANFVNASNEMQMRISFRQTGPILSYPWRVSVDRAIWEVSD